MKSFNIRKEKSKKKKKKKKLTFHSLQGVKKVPQYQNKRKWRKMHTISTLG